MQIEPGRIMNDFIEPNKRQYMIPVYQRNYKWSKAQCEKLFHDVVAAYKKDCTHFCGSVVFALLKEEHGIIYYILIDGQQRITTIYLMLKAMLDLSQTDKERESVQEALMNKDKFDQFGIDKASKLKLKPVKSDNNQLFLLMENRLEEIDKSCGIWHNYELFSTLIKEQQEQGLTIKDIYRGLEKLICAKIKLDENDNAQEIFERINSTGVPLSLEDKIRNFVLMADANQEKLYEEHWLKIENLVGKTHMSSFFLDFLNFKMDGFTNVEKAYDDFKQLYKDGHYTNASMLEEIHRYANFYHAFLFEDKRYSKELNKALQDLIRLKQTTQILFLFRVFDDLENGVIEEQTVVRILQFLVNYSIRRVICDVSSNSLRGLYKTLYARVFNRKENKEHYFDSVVSFFTQLTSRDAYISDEAFKKALKYNNLYRKNALCKFLLSNIENQGKEQVLVENMTIEHILPQNKNLSTAWQNMLGKNWEADRDRLLHTLGNLTLTGYNSELGDKPFLEKKELLEAKTKAVTLYADIKDCKKWDANTIEHRAEHLASIVLDLYPTIKPVEIIPFSDPRYNLYTCEDPETAKFKTPNYYILQGEMVNVLNYADMMRSVIGRLYVSTPEVIEEMARTNEHLIASWQTVMFSYDKSVVSNSDVKIKGTEIYVNASGYSATSIMLIIRTLLDRCEIDRNEFVYSARHNK